MMMLETRVGRYIVFTLVLAGVSVLAMHGRADKPGRVIVTETETEILDVVEFAPQTTLLAPTSFATLDAVAATLVGSPSIALLEVQAHTRGVGEPAANLELSARRARTVMAYLVAAGVPPTRLVAEGYGDTQPLDRPGSPKNERIAFVILQRE